MKPGQTAANIREEPQTAVRKEIRVSPGRLRRAPLEHVTTAFRSSNSASMALTTWGVLYGTFTGQGSATDFQSRMIPHSAGIVIRILQPRLPQREIESIAQISSVLSGNGRIKGVDSKSTERGSNHGAPHSGHTVRDGSLGRESSQSREATVVPSDPRDPATDSDCNTDPSTTLSPTLISSSGSRPK